MSETIDLLKLRIKLTGELLKSLVAQDYTPTYLLNQVLLNQMSIMERLLEMEQQS